MKIISPKEMKTLDNWAIKTMGIPQVVLMENAGRAVADQVKAGEKVVVVAYKGNNGGDGFVAGRHLSNKGCDVTIALLCNEDELTEAAKINFDIIKKLKIPIINKKLPLLAKALSNCSVVIDAIFGISFHGQTSGIISQAIKLINQSNRYQVIAVDVPSGIDAATGKVSTHTVKANITVTFAYPKTGLLEYPAIKYVGKLIVADIGIPLRKPRRLALPTGRRVAGFRQDYYMPQRKTWTHKGDYGKVLIIAGSRNMSGAAYLVSRAAIRSGAGLVYLAVPISIQKIVAPKTREVITYGLDETNEGTISLSALKQILQVKADVIAIGPGLGIQPYTRSLVKALIIKSKAKVLILDADALNAITDEVSILKKSRARVIITPHLGEFGRLINIKPAQIEQNREKYAKAFSRKYSVAVVLKGAYTMVVDKGRLSVNSSGNPGMATAGAGDVLTGIMAGFLAQGLSIPLAVYVHGLAGDLAARQKGQTSLIASDIIEKIPDAIQSIS